MMLRRLLLMLSILFVQQGWSAEPVRIGVLSFRALEQTQQQWQPLADYLQRSIPEHRFEVVPLYLPELGNAATENQLDFVFTNPEHFVILRQAIGLAAIATMMPMIEGHPVNQFGGVILSRADRNDIQTLSDLSGKIIASPSHASFGGYVMQRWELFRHDINPGEFRFTGMPHDKVVEEVLQGKADAGFVRSGILEAMTKEGKIQANTLKVINPRNLGHFPQMLSTDLYPEWPFAAPLATPQALIKAVSLALLNLNSSDPAARAAHIYGFAPPGDYSSVEAILLRLDLHPQEFKHIDLLDVYYKYRHSIWVGSLTLLIIGLLSVKLLHGNRRLKRTLLKIRQAQMELSLHNAALMASADAIIITDINAVIQWVNPAFCNLTGYSVAEAVGHTPAELVKSGEQDPLFYRQLWTTIRKGESWRGEIINRRKNGELYHEQLSINPVYGDGKNITHFVAVKQDITVRKQTEETIRQMAFYDPLTQLANRRLLVDRLEHTINSCRRTRHYGGLLFIDLDRFKALNDEYGHDAGDQLLIEVSNRLKALVRMEDTVARLGGDEFVVLLVDLNGNRALAQQQAKKVAEKIRTTIAQPYTMQINDRQHTSRSLSYGLTASIGVTLFLDDDHSGNKILKQADDAMYEAKHSGRDSICSFSEKPYLGSGE
jgi:diguanylate cyclase (GGDEF)-like protein/PAS domain S-box-containing protein